MKHVYKGHAHAYTYEKRNTDLLYNELIAWKTVDSIMHSVAKRWMSIHHLQRYHKNNCNVGAMLTNDQTNNYDGRIPLKTKRLKLLT